MSGDGAQSLRAEATRAEVGRPIVRIATVADAAAITRIYNQGIEDPIATFYRRHGKLDGQWRDCVTVEKLLGDASCP
jgi:hypothetical protein